ncbi:hypothetical protein QQF64_034154 [Cirrhinus molitorella]|uniref:LINE-1 type transposase domain-containing 1 n=1 Tax=Cirrhinus molitorella TaxID=172907 RepID=A0ABR3MW19_9TELE
MPKAKKTVPKSSTISDVEQDANMDDASVTSREEESSNTNFAQALDKLSENITKVIDEKVNTVLSAISDQTVQLQALAERVGQAEERIAGVENSAESLQTTVADLQKKVSDMLAHIDDLENRGRRCNLRLVRLPEGTEGSDPVHFFEKWLPDYLKIATKAGRIKLDRAHRSSLVPLPGAAQ